MYNWTDAPGVNKTIIDDDSGTIRTYKCRH